jgi:hypothetical protein
MKTLFRNLAAFTLTFGALLVFCQPAQAQSRLVYSPQSAIAFTSITNNTTVTLTNIVMDVRKQAKVAVQTSAVSVASNTDNVVYTITRSVDGTTYETTGTTITVASTGTTAAVTVTEIDCKGAGYLKLHSIQNASASVGLGAVSVKWGLKIP